jgi:CheY-like chemotaxis protein
MTHVTTPTARTILVVDDERAVREYARLVLEDAGYLVLTAADGREGLDLAERLGRRLHLLVTDVLMPVMDGRRLAAQLRARRPDLPVVFTTGLGNGDWAAEETPASFLEGTAILAKPFTADQLEAVVVALLDGAPAARAAAVEDAWDR